MAETETVIPDYERGLTFEKVWAAIHTTDRQLKERDQEWKKEREERDREWTEKMKETQRIVDAIGKKSGYMDNRFGELAEHLVAPNIAEKFNALGFHFDGISPGGKEITDGKGNLLAEVDLLLENGEYILAVEVKAKPRRKDLEEHLKRLEVLRRHYDKLSDRRKLRGAIAGAIFHGEMKTAVGKAGLYVIEQSGDTVKIVITDGFTPRDWQPSV